MQPGSFHTHVLEEGLLLSRTFAAAGFQRWVKPLESALLREGFYQTPSPHGDVVPNDWRSCSWRVLRGGVEETGGDWFVVCTHVKNTAINPSCHSGGNVAGR